MKRNFGLLFVALMSLGACGGSAAPTTLLPEIDEVRLLFSKADPKSSQYYNYCPTSFVENNVQHIYYCTNESDGNVTDFVGYRTGQIIDNKLVYSEEELILTHGEVGVDWDSRHVCDPSVVKGNFTYNEETYSYLMAYLGCSSSDVTLNETGLAVSKTPAGPWIKVAFEKDGVTKLRPIVPVTDFTDNQKCWGTGQPSLVSVNEAGEVLLFTSVGIETATFTNLRHYDFSNLNDVKLIDEQRTIMTTGVVGTSTGASFINNADFAYDKENQRVLMVKGRQHYNADGKLPNQIESILDVYYIDDTERTGVGSVLFAGNNTTKQWKLMGSINQDLTGFLRNHNPGFITNEYGHILNTDALPVAFTRADEGGGWQHLATYRIYATSIAFPKKYF